MGPAQKARLCGIRQRVLQTFGNSTPNNSFALLSTEVLQKSFNFVSNNTIRRIPIILPQKAALFNGFFQLLGDFVTRASTTRNRSIRFGQLRVTLQFKFIHGRFVGSEVHIPKRGQIGMTWVAKPFNAALRVPVPENPDTRVRVAEPFPRCSRRAL